MELSIYFPQNQPKRYILQFPKQIGNEFYWLVKKPLSMGTIMAVPLHEIDEINSLNTVITIGEMLNYLPKPFTVYFRVGRHLHGSTGFFRVEAIPLFQPIKTLK